MIKQHRLRFEVLLTITTWMLFTAAVTQWILINYLGDVWWSATILLFAPRWPLLVPLVVLAALSVAWWRKLLWVDLVSLFVLVGPVIGFCVPVSLLHANDDGFRFRVMTVNSGEGAAWDLLTRDIELERPDVVAFQEFGDGPPQKMLNSRWHWQVAGGMAIASRYPILAMENFPASRVGRWSDVAVSVQLKLPIGDIWFCCVHLNTPRWGFEELRLTRHGLSGIDDVRKNTEQRDFESHTIQDWVAKLDGPLIIAGDFNMPVESHFFRRDWAVYQDAFSTAGWGYGHTKFTRWHGVRIDHVLLDGNWRATGCHVAEFTGGDHRPVVAELELRK